MLADEDWVGEVVPLASARTSTATLDFRDASVAVDVLDEQAMEDLDALVLAVPADVAAVYGPRALGVGRPVVDASGAFPGAPLFVPRVTAAPTQGPRVVAVPGPSAALLARLLAPIRAAGISGPATATVMVPASASGRDGVDELSRQVVALFSSGTPPRKVFPDGLAFDLSPAVGPLRADGWTDDEVAVAAQVVRLVPGAPVHVTLVRVPVFSGISVQLSVAGGAAWTVRGVEAALFGAGLRGPTAAGARGIPRPRRVEGQPAPRWGRLRRSDDGALHVWASADNLRSSAVALVEACRLLVGATSADRMSDASDDDDDA